MNWWMIALTLYPVPPVVLITAGLIKYPDARPRRGDMVDFTGKLLMAVAFWPIFLMGLVVEDAVDRLAARRADRDRRMLDGDDR